MWMIYGLAYILASIALYTYLLGTAKEDPASQKPSIRLVDYGDNTPADTTGEDRLAA